MLTTEKFMYMSHLDSSDEGEDMEAVTSWKCRKPEKLRKEYDMGEESGDLSPSFKKPVAEWLKVILLQVIELRRLLIHPSCFWCSRYKTKCHCCGQEYRECRWHTYCCYWITKYIIIWFQEHAYRGRRFVLRCSQFYSSRAENPPEKFNPFIILGGTGCFGPL